MLDVTVLEALPQKLTGKVALVTGSARGLGRAYAIRLARLGADVVVNDVNLQANREYDEPLTPGCETVADEIRALDRRSLAIQADVTDETQVRGMVQEIVSTLGTVDILVCNAGGRCGELPGQRDGHRRLQAHAGHQPHRHHPGLPGRRAGDEGPAPGKIVTVGSRPGCARRAGAAHSYSVAKAAIHHYTRKLASELGPYNVTVNAIAPGWILSSRAIASGRGSLEMRERLAGEIALQRLGEPEDCARVVGVPVH